MWEFFFCHHRHLGGLHSGDIWLGCLLFVFVIWMGLGTQSLHHWCSNCLWHFTIIVANIAGKKSAERLSAGEKSKRCSCSTNRSSGQMWPTAVKKKKAAFAPKCTIMMCKEGQTFAAIDSRPFLLSSNDPSQACFFPPLKLSEDLVLYYLLIHLYWQFEVMLMAHSAEPGAHCSAPFL